MPEIPIQGQVLILATGTAGAGPYLAAAKKLHLAYAFATEQEEEQPRPAPAPTTDEADRHGFSESLPDLRLHFAQRESALEIVQYAMEHPLAAVVATDDRTAPTCARASSMLHLPWHPPRAADLCLDGLALQHRLGDAGLAMPLPDKTLSGQHFAVAAILNSGKMRVLGTLVYASSGLHECQAEPVKAPAAVYESILCAACETGLSHGPLSALVCLADEKAWILTLGLAIPASLAIKLRFRIPLVDEDVSLAEVILRHAVGMDISRIYARGFQ